jgi:hypothetical protein
MYVSTEREFNLHSEDVRLINMKHEEIVAQTSSRRKAPTSNKKTYMLDELEIEALKLKCWQPINK